MKAEEFRKLSIDELKRKEKDLKDELFNLRFQLATKKIENPVRVRVVRRDIARVKTILREMS
ncbi:MAG: 50S ribosomal protein L29 [Nitrospinae bacterium]|nr:50S ribosomal protein L29 [Nitrospinota bacterium]